jgi:phosphoribosyl 1,2-cyclic phosphodiesterase
MKLTIWGARGSIPTPLTTEELRERLRETLERSKGLNLDDPEAIQRHIERLPPTINTVVSGNTSCVEVRVNDSLFIFDMGSGIRLLGKKLMGEAFREGKGVANIFISHTHYDHLEGYPFFVPAFIPGNQLNWYSPYADLEARFRDFMRHPFFPVDWDYPQSSKTFTTLDPSQHHIVDGVEVSILELDHPGKSFAYRLSFGGKKLIYASDGEYPSMEERHTASFEEFFRDADVLIFDAMYTYEDAVTSKAEWGHSSARVAAELAWRSNIKKIILTHHDPISTRQELWAKIDDADHHLRYRASREGREDFQPVEVLLAYEGLTLDI